MPYHNIHDPQSCLILPQLLFQVDDSIRNYLICMLLNFFFFFQAEDGIRDDLVTGVQTCALPIFEALACGTPVLAFPCGSVPEILEQGITAHFGDTVEDLVAAVERIDEIDRRT